MSWIGGKKSLRELIVTLFPSCYERYIEVFGGSAALLVHGEKAHSCYFSRDAFEKLTGNNKELLIIPRVVHTDLYDKVDVIPFDKMKEFFRKNLK